MPRVVHFEIHAEDPARALRFYEFTFGWRFQKWNGPEDYWLVVTGPDSEPGINGGMVRRRGKIDGSAVLAYVCTVQVDALDPMLNKVTGAGAEIVVPKMAVPGVGWLAYAKDTEGNIFGLMQADPTAK